MPKLLIACGNTPKLLYFIEEPFDRLAYFVRVLIVCDRLLTIARGRNNRITASVLSCGADVMAALPFGHHGVFKSIVRRELCNHFVNSRPITPFSSRAHERYPDGLM